MKNRGLIFAVLAIVAIVLLLSAMLGGNKPVPTVTIPSPNGYDVLAEVGRLIQDIPDDYAETTDVASLKACIATNGEGLEKLANVDSMNFAVPIPRDAGLEASMACLIEECGALRQSIRLLHVEARVAELEGQIGLAAERYARIFAIGSQSANGGLLINKQASLALERIAITRLSELVDELSEEERAAVLAIIGTTNRRPGRVRSEFVARDHNLVRNQHGALFGNWMIYQTKSSQRKSIETVESADMEIEDLFQSTKQKLLDSSK